MPKLVINFKISLLAFWLPTDEASMIYYRLSTAFENHEGGLTEHHRIESRLGSHIVNIDQICSISLNTDDINLHPEDREELVKAAASSRDLDQEIAAIAAQRIRLTQLGLDPDTRAKVKARSETDIPF